MIDNFALELNRKNIEIAPFVNPVIEKVSQKSV